MTIVVTGGAVILLLSPWCNHCNMALCDEREAEISMCHHFAATDRVTSPSGATAARRDGGGKCRSSRAVDTALCR